MTVPFIVRLGAFSAFVTASRSTWVPVILASGSAVLLGLPAALVLELPLLPHAAAATQLAATAAIDAMRTKSGRIWNIIFSPISARETRTDCRGTVFCLRDI